MLLRKNGQSTAEYAIVIGLVIAIAAGVLQVALKGGIRQKNQQALNYMLGAGNTNTEFNAAATATPGVSTYTQEYRQTTLPFAAYVDESVMQKGGLEKRYQKQESQTTAVSIETIDKATK